jgi:Aldo/keto reductase family
VATGWRSLERQPKEVFIRYKIFSERSGLKVSELALGTGMFGQAWGYGATPEEVRRIIAGFAGAGGNFIDTADNYQHGVSETLVGEAIAANRDEFVIATKFTRGASAKLAVTLLGNNRKNMVQSVEASLKRLKTDRIDLYFVHMDDFVTPMEEIDRGPDDLAALARSFMEASPISRPGGSLPPPTRPTSEAGRRSPPFRLSTTSCNARRSANCCPWPMDSGSA